MRSLEELHSLLNQDGGQTELTNNEMALLMLDMLAYDLREMDNRGEQLDNFMLTNTPGIPEQNKGGFILLGMGDTTMQQDGVKLVDAFIQLRQYHEKQNTTEVPSEQADSVGETPNP